MPDGSRSETREPEATAHERGSPKTLRSASELRGAWRDIVYALQRDLAFAGRLARDPIGTLHDLGYDVTGEAALVLRRAV